MSTVAVIIFDQFSCSVCKILLLKYLIHKRASSIKRGGGKEKEDTGICGATAAHLHW